MSTPLDICIKWVPQKIIDKKTVKQLLKDTIQTDHYTNYGPNVRRLESELRTILKINTDKAIIAVNSGTAALHALASGLNMYYGRSLQYCTQSFTFPPSAQAILHSAHIVDIDAGGGLDLTAVPPDTDAIIVTNIFGNIVDIDRYTQWAKQHDKLLIFDNAATPFTMYSPTGTFKTSINACNFGTAAIISLHHTKPIGFGEGGAIIVDSIYEHSIRLAINFGIDNNLPKPRYHQYASNYKMSDIAAIYAMQYLRRLPHIVSIHNILYAYMTQKIHTSQHPIISEIQLYPNHSMDNPFISCFCLLHDKFTPTVVTACMERGIFCRKYYIPLKDTPIADAFYQRIICFPCTIDMTIHHIDHILNVLADIFTPQTSDI